MSYATLTDLARRSPWSALARTAAQDDAAVEGDLLKQAAGGSALSAYSAADRAAAQAAVDWLNKALADAAEEIDGYLAGRYDAATLAASDALNGRCIDIADYRLFGGDEESKRYILYDRAVKWLEAVSQGKIDLLPADDPSAGDGEIRVNAPPRVFNDASLADYMGEV